jgi:hypothetical protein
MLDGICNPALNVHALLTWHERVGGVTNSAQHRDLVLFNAKQNEILELLRNSRMTAGR